MSVELPQGRDGARRVNGVAIGRNDYFFRRNGNASCWNGNDEFRTQERTEGQAQGCKSSRCMT